jgi:hypothetical protein
MSLTSHIRDPIPCNAIKCWGAIPNIDRWATITGRYEGAQAEEAVPFLWRRPLILILQR